MYLLTPEQVAPHINNYYTTYTEGSILLGYMQCSANNGDYQVSIKYYSVETPIGLVVPVFYVPDMHFDSEDDTVEPGPALFFMGSDDGHMGLRFSTKIQALMWIEECTYVDFAQLLIDNWTTDKIQLHSHN